MLRVCNIDRVEVDGRFYYYICVERKSFFSFLFNSFLFNSKNGKIDYYTSVEPIFTSCSDGTESFQDYTFVNKDGDYLLGDEMWEANCIINNLVSRANEIKRKEDYKKHFVLVQSSLKRG